MVVDGRSVMGKQGFGGAVDPFKVDSNGLEFQTLHSIALHCIADHFEYIALHLKQISLLQCDTRQKILLPCNELRRLRSKSACCWSPQQPCVRRGATKIALQCLN